MLQHFAVLTWSSSHPKSGCCQNIDPIAQSDAPGPVASYALQLALPALPCPNIGSLPMPHKSNSMEHHPRRRAAGGTMGLLSAIPGQLPTRVPWQFLKRSASHISGWAHLDPVYVVSPVSCQVGWPSMPADARHRHAHLQPVLADAGAHVARASKHHHPWCAVIHALGLKPRGNCEVGTVV
jgi:hypothetical protein